MKKYLVLDLEYRIDREAHRRYLAMERFDPAAAAYLPQNDERVTPRWPFRRPVAASWLLMEPDGDGVLSPVRLTTVGLPEADERGILERLFSDIAEAGDIEIVTWSGVTTDMPQLLVTAMMLGMTLPTSMRPLAEPFNNRARRHLDLMLAVCGAAGRCHMTEIAAVLGIPAKPIGAPTAVAGYIKAGKWSLVKATAEADTFVTSLILLHHLGLTAPGGLFGPADRIAAFAAAQTHRGYAAEFAEYRERLLRDAFTEARAAHTLLAA